MNVERISMANMRLGEDDALLLAEFLKTRCVCMFCLFEFVVLYSPGLGVGGTSSKDVEGGAMFLSRFAVIRFFL